jgi:hypothetical protein|tara:strand:+ start:567 stop:824 length:258 start_codon:yes stop_codon:yes gene_type:complete
MNPKQEFQRDPQRLNSLKKILDNQDFQTALLAAFNNFCWNLPASENPQHGWNANCRRQGAKALIDELNGLAEMRKEKPTTTQNLE